MVVVALDCSGRRPLDGTDPGVEEGDVAGALERVRARFPTLVDDVDEAAKAQSGAVRCQSESRAGEAEAEAEA